MNFARYFEKLREKRKKSKERKDRRGSQNENYLPHSYSAYPQMYFPVGRESQPQIVQPAGYHGQQMVHTGYDTRGYPTFTSTPNLAMPIYNAHPNVMPPDYPRLSTSMSHPHGLVMPPSTPHGVVMPEQHPHSLLRTPAATSSPITGERIELNSSSETVATREEKQPLPDCIVPTDQEMPSVIDMEELWRPRRTSTMTRLAHSFHDLSMKDKEWEGFRSRRGNHYY